MQINEINCDEKLVSLVLSRDEVRKLMRAMSTGIDWSNGKASDEDKWLHLQLVGVVDILEDGNFMRFLSYHRRFVESELEKNE